MSFCHGSIHILEIHVTMREGAVAKQEVGVVHVWRQLALGVHVLLFIMAYMYMYYGQQSLYRRQQHGLPYLWI